VRAFPPFSSAWRGRKGWGNDGIEDGAISAAVVVIAAAWPVGYSSQAPLSALAWKTVPVPLELQEQPERRAPRWAACSHRGSAERQDGREL
jgi:hypothetical protein